MLELTGPCEVESGTSRFLGRRGLRVPEGGWGLGWMDQLLRSVMLRPLAALMNTPAVSYGLLRGYPRGTPWVPQPSYREGLEERERWKVLGARELLDWELSHAEAVR